MDTQQLTRYGMMAQKHWLEERPKMCALLERKGLLKKALYQAQEGAKTATCNLLDQGRTRDEAEEIVLHQYLLLPSEKEMPHLGEMPQSYKPTQSQTVIRSLIPCETSQKSMPPATSSPTITLLKQMMSGKAPAP